MDYTGIDRVGYASVVRELWLSYHTFKKFTILKLWLSCRTSRAAENTRRFNAHIKYTLIIRVFIQQRLIVFLLIFAGYHFFLHSIRYLHPNIREFIKARRRNSGIDFFINRRFSIVFNPFCIFRQNKVSHFTYSAMGFLEIKSTSISYLSDLF